MSLSRGRTSLWVPQYSLDHFFSGCSGNSEANASELLKHLNETNILKFVIGITKQLSWYILIFDVVYHE